MDYRTYRLQDQEDYRTRWTTGPGGLQDQEDYRTRWTTGPGGLQDQEDYRTRWTTVLKTMVFRTKCITIFRSSWTQWTTVLRS